MATVFTDEAMERIETMRREQVSRLASRAAHMTVERDCVTGGWIVRNPAIPGRCEIVTPDGQCSCARYQVWDRCKHVALVETRQGEGQS